jgi:hypothetical protein
MSHSFLARYWFPLALTPLFLLALPGLLLLALNLVGADGPVNDWLEEELQLSYHMALPAPVAIVLLLVVPAIIVLYFLKLKRKPLQVPSTFLWRKSIEDLHVNSLFQWLRENILLIMQVLAVLVLIYAVLGFRFHGNTTRGRHYILIIDNSASMAATDLAPSRLHWAKQEALKEIDAASEEDVGMVIVFNAKATTLQAYTNNRAKLRQAVLGIEQTHRPTRIEEALNLADSLANPVRSTEDVAVRPEGELPGQERTYVPPKGISTSVHLFSDGRFANLSESALAGLNSRLAGNSSVLGNLNLKYHMAGAAGPESTNNVAIVALNVIRLTNELAKGGGDLQNLRALVRIRNYRREPAPVNLRLDVIVQGKIIHPEQKQLEIRARTLTKGEGDDAEAVDEPGEATVTFDLPPLDVRVNTVLHAYLDRNKDALSLDDEAWLVTGTVRKAKVLIAGPANAILDAFFDQEATKKVAKVERISAADLDGNAYAPARNGQFDLVIFDRCAPTRDQDMPQASTFFIDRPPPPWQRSKKPLPNPYLVIAKKEHPLMRHITSLWDVGVTDAFRFDAKNDLDDKAKADFERADTDPQKRLLPPITRLIESGNEVPLLFTMPRGPYTDLVMTFPLINDKSDLTTNWSLQPSFPLFMRNVLYELGSVRDAVREATVQPGEPLVLRPEAGVNWLEVTAPGGDAVKLVRGQSGNFTYAATDRLGLYRIDRDDGGKSSFAVNLLDASESMIEPRAEIHIGSERYTTGEERKQPVELWKWIILLALILLMVEWYIYNRRIYI